ncbi:hypothetical protein D3C84_1102470 [compost metagenome]
MSHDQKSVKAIFRITAEPIESILNSLTCNSLAYDKHTAVGGFNIPGQHMFRVDNDVVHVFPFGNNVFDGFGFALTRLSRAEEQFWVDNMSMDVIEPRFCPLIQRGNIDDGHI